MIGKHHEISTIIRFAIIGITTAAIYFFGYNLLRLEPLLSAGWASFTSYIAAILFQYFGHSYFTFRSKISNMSQVFRFLMLNGFGLAFAVGVTILMTAIFDAPSWVASGLVVLTLPIINWIVMRFWVFA